MKNLNRVPLSILVGLSLAAFSIGYVVAPTGATRQSHGIEC